MIFGKRKKTLSVFTVFEDPIRSELLNVTHLEEIAFDMAQDHNVYFKNIRGANLSKRVNENEKVLIESFKFIVKSVKEERLITPAAEWFIDNFYIIEEQLKDIRENLPIEFYKELPKLSNGKFKNFPRIYAIAWEFVARTDSLFNPEHLKLLLRFYQNNKVLSIGELWAISITIRIVLIENLRRLSARIVGSELAREQADQVADELLGLSGFKSRTEGEIIESLKKLPFKKGFEVQLIQRLRFQEGVAVGIFKWLDERLHTEGIAADVIVSEEHSNQTSANVTVRNIITSMRLLSSLDWRDFFEEVSLVDETFQEDPLFGQLDFSTRDKYRHSLEELARGSKLTELEVAKKLIAKTKAERDLFNHTKEPSIERRSELGFHLISKGRYEFEKEIKFKRKLRNHILRFYIENRNIAYIGAICTLTLALPIVLIRQGAFSFPFSVMLFIFSLFPASEMAIIVVNQLMIYLLMPRYLPRLDFSKYIPTEFKTFTVVPTMLLNRDDIADQVKQLEVHFLSNPNENVYFGLLSDWKDSNTEHLPNDEELFSLALDKIKQLNTKYGQSLENKNKFYLFHRYRKWNKSEQKWIGWERKRGKIQEFNHYLRGQSNTSFITLNEHELDIPKDIKYVITLDADTRLPRGAVAQLIGTLAHPLNHPIFDLKLNRVVEGYGILQPRITPTLPELKESTYFQKISSGPCGIDPYASAVSDVYQDLFGEGSYTGKGIYNVDVFEQALRNRTPEDRLLSHDLYEGNFARCGLISDVEFFEEFPSSVQVSAKRNHRWIRGDWQLLPWILGRSGNGISLIGRWKMLDNLRRSMLMPMSFFIIINLLLIPNISLVSWFVFIFFALGFSSFLPTFINLYSYRFKIPFKTQLKYWGKDFLMGISQFVLTIVFMPFKAWTHLDAIIRTIYRLTLSKRNLLEWTTSAQTKLNSENDLINLINIMIGPLLTLLTIVIFCSNLFFNHFESYVMFFILWLCSPIAAWWISLPPLKGEVISLTENDKIFLRIRARKIWHFFSTFVTDKENFLPPDNFQEIPQPVIAHRSSPTNFGLYLMSVISARDFGWIGIHEMVERLSSSLISMQGLSRYNGHFYNWYDTLSRNALEPRYISSVDNGNFAGHLLAVAQSCEEMARSDFQAIRYSNNAKLGIQDSLRVLREQYSTGTDRLSLLIIDEFLQLINKSESWESLITHSALFIIKLKEIEIEKIRKDSEVKNWINTIDESLKNHAKEFLGSNIDADLQASLKKQLIELAILCRQLLKDMDFSFLFDPKRKLFSIGYRPQDSSLDESFYDLLASESRLLSFVAIAKGDVDVSHWFRLGRSLTSIKNGLALISWSGSMFEYLMPSLVMETPTTSLLQQTCSLIVKKQIEYSNLHSMPWGMSESAYNVRDHHLTYQYSNFGVPDLAFKRGIGKDLVIAPYATMLAGMYDANSAVKNLRRLSEIKAEGCYGFYESIDYTKARIPENNAFSIVKTYMAHHQGMSLVAISNMLHDNIMVKRFHREPIIQSTSLLLQERTPRNVVLAKTRQEAVRVEHVYNSSAQTFRYYTTPYHNVPRTHLLSNGSYSVMITSGGGGFSRFNDKFISRWREDVTLDNWGSFIYLRDIHSHHVWSAAHQPMCIDSNEYEVIFTEDRAKIKRNDHLLSSELEIFISPEDNAEIRRLSLTNNGNEVKVIEATTYAEVVLTTLGADIAHPAFSNLFIQTEFLPEISALIVKRRVRGHKESPLWIAHIVSTDSNCVGDIEYETDRSQFIGRGRTIRNPIILETKKLSNTTGTVLDPIISLRSRVRIEPGSTANITYTTMVAESREEIIKLAEKFHEVSSYERASNLAWTQSQVKLHYLGIIHGEANLFQQLANRILFLDSSLRVSSDILKRNTRNATNLWAYGISGDHPIVLVRIDDIEQRGLVRQILRAHEYWGIKCLDVDIVVLNDKLTSYSQELQIDIESLASASRISSGTHLPKLKGKIFTLRTDLIAHEDINLLETAARAILVGRQGNLAEQVKRMVRKVSTPFKNSEIKISNAKSNEIPLPVPKLDFYNGLGGFSEFGREYIIRLKSNETTPAPWINIIANSEFGFHVSESGVGSTWASNSRENKLTPWSNDPVSDPSGECFYIFDNDKKELWSPTISPIRILNAEYIIRHGQGYSQFELRHLGILSILTQYVDKSLPVKISKIVLKNESSLVRNLTITSYVEWVLGFSRSNTSNYLVTSFDELSGSLICQNSWNQEFSTRKAFAGFVGGNDSWTGNRTEFIGRNGNMRRPQALLKNQKLSNQTGAGLDACGAFQKKISIPAHSEVTLLFILGQEDNIHKVQELINFIEQKSCNDILKEAILAWDDILGVVQVETPDLAMNIMLNRWLLYQSVVCRLWSRSAFYQSGGAYGFRDQLQDSMSVVWSRPDMMSEQILKSASRQFLEGDVQHWWHMPTGRGVRTHFSDDLLWLPYVVNHYLKRTANTTLLDKEIFFLKGETLPQEEEDSYYTPEVATEKATLYEHCARAIDHSLKVGSHGFPLIGGGDWNDGMNRVGHEGKGESVWLAWFLIINLGEFVTLAESRGEFIRANIWRDHRVKLLNSLEEHGWDGEWYKRAFYDDGTPLGSKENSECKIDSLTQSWGIISKAGNKEKLEEAMSSVEKYLIKNNEKMILLFTPPFDKTNKDPGYIKGYSPGVRENGGQYTHAAIWCILAYAELNNGQKAVELFSMLNPINHSLTRNEVEIYKVEPYVIAADVYSVAPHVGRGGWTWYTGSAGWMYTVGIEVILGFKLTGNILTIDPKIHSEWKSFKIFYKYKTSQYEILINNPNALTFGVRQNVIELQDDGGHHLVAFDLVKEIS